MAKPQWDIPQTKPVDPAPLPETLERRIREILSAYRPERIDMVVHGVSDAIAKYQTVKAFRDNEPKKAEKREAAKKLSHDALDLADKLPDCGGADVVLRKLLADSEHNDELIFELKKNLEAFAALCDQAASAPDQIPMPKNAKHVLADELARIFAFNLEERPASTVTRDNSQNHVFTMLLKAVMEHCQGRRMPSDLAVEPFAIAGIESGLSSWKTFFEKKSTKTRT